MAFHSFLSIMRLLVISFIILTMNLTQSFRHLRSSNLLQASPEQVHTSFPWLLQPISSAKLIPKSSSSLLRTERCVCVCFYFLEEAKDNKSGADVKIVICFDLALKNKTNKLRAGERGCLKFEHPLPFQFFFQISQKQQRRPPPLFCIPVHTSFPHML